MQNRDYYLGCGTVVAGAVIVGVGIAKDSRPAIVAGGVLAALGMFLLFRPATGQLPQGSAGISPSIVGRQRPDLPAPRQPSTTSKYSNLEEITFPEGFDPDTFMPRKIVVKRNAELGNG